MLPIPKMAMGAVITSYSIHYTKLYDLAQHTFEHELQCAADAGMLGSIDANKGDYQNGWDTDEFPTNIYETTQAMMVILEAGGLQGGGVNFDAKARRNSTDLEDIFIGHISGMDTFARSLLIADAILNHSSYKKMKAERYASYATGKGGDFVAGKLNRITSYNVCYTKLLRVLEWKSSVVV